MRLLVLAVDGIFVVLAMILAYVVQDFLREWIPQLQRPPRFEDYVLVVYLTLPLWLVLIRVFGFDRVFETHRGVAGIIVDLLKIDVVGILILSLLVFLTKTKDLNRSLVGLFVISFSLLLLVDRILLRGWISYQYASGQTRLRVLLVGSPGIVGARLAALAPSDRPPTVVGYVGEAEASSRSTAKAETHLDREAGTDTPAFDHLGPLDGLTRVLHDHPIDRVLILPPFDRLGDIAAIAATCHEIGVPTSLVINHDHYDLDPPQLEDLPGLRLLSFEHRPKSPASLAVKHTLDILTSAILLVLVSPLFLLVALGILITMGRPIFFSQERAGLFGRSFRMLKFRTMARDAETQHEALAHLNETDGPTFKAHDDPRITVFGRLLRRSSLDELPQLLHVLSGKMSLVGPRPLPKAEQQAIRGWRRRRLSMKPGITGLWQVSGRSEIGFEAWMRLDLDYVDRWSLSLDAWILLRTIPAVLRGKGAI
ncbi:MAG: sugar transferase [Deltaproteobacteria bacterium]|nr:sugar transferase [Deltaproteobacteria bacterium]